MTSNFPIIRSGGMTIPWSVAEHAYLEYVKKYGDGQTLQQIANRGGFWIEEMDKLHPEWREHIRLQKENKYLQKLLRRCEYIFEIYKVDKEDVRDRFDSTLFDELAEK